MITYQQNPSRTWQTWITWLWSNKDGSPVLKDQAVWWKHVSGVVVARKHMIIFRHNEEG